LPWSGRQRTSNFSGLRTGWKLIRYRAASVKPQFDPELARPPECTLQFLVRTN
jgi:hypothetical protein